MCLLTPKYNILFYVNVQKMTNMLKMSNQKASCVLNNTPLSVNVTPHPTCGALQINFETLYYHNDSMSIKAVSIEL